MLKVTCLYFLLVLSITETSRILGVFPTPSISHQIVFRPLMEELANRGHEIVVITADPAYLKGKSPRNFTEIDVHTVSYGIISEFSEKIKGSDGDFIKETRCICEFLAKLFEVQVQSEQVQNLINDKQVGFDLIFIESYIRPLISFSYLYQAPLIEFSSFGGYYGTFENIGAVTHPLIYPNAMQRKITNLTIWQKINELYKYYSILSLFEDYKEYENKMLLKLFGPLIPSIDELKKNIHMSFLNTHSIWDFNRPVPPNVIYVGQMHLQKERAKGLPQDLQSFMESSHNGVIYMSFGTNVQPSLLPPEKIKIFTKVFSQVPYKILWKWDTDKPPSLSKNIKISKWFPQSMLLKHSKIKLFITQGGLQSTDEALTAGVPLIAVPMHGDQWFNAEQYVIHGFGKILKLEDLNENLLKDAIENIIENTSYRKNAQRLGKIMRDQSQSSLEKAVWWTEYVLRHNGAKHLMSPAAHMSLVEYYEIKIVAILLGTILICCIVAIFMLRLLIKLYCSKTIKVKEN